MTDVRPHTTNLQAVRTCIHSITCDPARERGQIEPIAKACLRPRDSRKRPDVVNGVDSGRADTDFGLS
jgi:hypothetical protein